MRTRVDRPRIIGTLKERLMLHMIAFEVVKRLEELHPELDIDSEALEHVRLGFLREPCRKLGLCSYADQRPGRPATEFTDRHNTHRILLSRISMYDDLPDAVFTIHHEFLHAILGSEEGHGATFQEHEHRINSHIEEIAQFVRHATKDFEIPNSSYLVQTRVDESD